MKASQLIAQLTAITNQNIHTVKSFQTLSIEALSKKPNKETWCVLECIEHLNRYGRFYIPEIRASIEHTKYKAKDDFKSGILGGYFVKSLLPKKKLSKMKTFKEMDPLGMFLGKTVLDEFLCQQDDILALLQKSLETDLNKVKTSISITRFVRLRLGDTLQVLVNHN